MSHEQVPGCSHNKGSPEGTKTDEFSDRFYIFHYIEAIFDHENMTKHANVNVSPETHKFVSKKDQLDFFERSSILVVRVF